MFTGKKHTEETKEKMKKHHIGTTGKHWKLSQETKDKIGEAHKDKPGYWLGKKRPQFSIETRTKMSTSRKGIKLSDDTKKKLSISKIGKNNPMFGKTGDKHHNYIIDREQLKTDRSKAYDTKYKYWMVSVKNRDGWKCKINNKDCYGRLEAHHILPWSKFPKLRYNINNGISLCQFHHPYKRKDEIKLAPFFMEIVAVTV